MSPYKVPKLILVPQIVVEESELSGLSIPTSRPMPSLDLTQMRNNSGAGYSPVEPNYSRQDHLQARYYPQQSDSEDESGSQISWANIGGPESQIATSTGHSEL